jgi:hypothetical protein
VAVGAHRTDFRILTALSRLDGTGVADAATEWPPHVGRRDRTADPATFLHAWVQARSRVAQGFRT